MAKKSKPLASERLALPVEMIERRIFLIRGHKVMLDHDIAELYAVPTKVLTRIFNLMYDLPTFQRPSASLFIGARSR